MKRKSKILILVLAAFILLAQALVLNTRVAFAAPRVPQAPAVLFHEDFEHNLSSGQIDLIASAVPPHQRYQSAGGGFYTAQGEWAQPNRCNGFVLDGNTTNAEIQSTGCAAGHGPLQTMARALGEINGTVTPVDNHAAAAYTAGNPGANLIEIENDGLLSLDVQNRFVMFSVNVAALNCEASAPLLHFYLDDGSSELPATIAPINPCTMGSPFDSILNSARGSFMSDNPLLFNGNTIGIVMRNQNGSGSGNDHAFDDLRILDASPVLDKTFGSGNYKVGDNIPITFTVTNTTDLEAKQGWSFTDNLDPNLMVSDTPALQNTCTNSSVTANPGSSAITVTGDLNDGQDYCEVTLNLKAKTAGTYANGPSHLTISGLKPPGGPATVTVGEQPEALANTGSNMGLYIIFAAALMTISIGLFAWRTLIAGFKR